MELIVEVAAREEGVGICGVEGEEEEEVIIDIGTAEIVVHRRGLLHIASLKIDLNGRRTRLLVWLSEGRVVAAPVIEAHLQLGRFASKKEEDPIGGTDLLGFDFAVMSVAEESLMET